MESYDPMRAPDPQDWLSLDEGERIALVVEYHEEASVKLPNQRAHAAMHVVVENQAAMGSEVATQAALERLMREGLDRHEAVHAAAQAVEGLMQDMLGDNPPNSPNVALETALRNVSARSWRRGKV